MNPGTSIGDIRVLPVIDGQAVWNGAELYRLGNDGRTGRGLETSDWDSHPEFLDEEGRMTLELRRVPGPPARRSGDTR